jgi:hypothetical protein
VRPAFHNKNLLTILNSPLIELNARLPKFAAEVIEAGSGPHAAVFEFDERLVAAVCDGSPRIQIAAWGEERP